MEALISFLPTEANGAVGSLDWTDEERRRLAAESVKWCCPACGNAFDLLPELKAPKEGAAEDDAAGAADKYATEIAQLNLHSVTSPKSSPGKSPAVPPPPPPPPPLENGAAAEDERAGAGFRGTDGRRAVEASLSAPEADPTSGDPAAAVAVLVEEVTPPFQFGGGDDTEERRGAPIEGGTDARAASGERLRRRPAAAVVAAAANGGGAAPAREARNDRQERGGAASGGGQVQRASAQGPDTLWYVAVALTLAIAGLLVRKVSRAIG